MDRPTLIDTEMHGHSGITGCYLVSGAKTALIDTGPKSSVEAVLRGLESSGVHTLDVIVLTHIHLDHAGAAGTLAQHFPNATIAVHPVGAPHLVDPAKLWSSAARIYGDQMDRLWGGVDPVAEERIRIIEDSDRIDLGGRVLRAVETPGHAYHHHSYLDESSGDLYAGDALGVRLGDAGIVRPATPPPEFHLTKATESIRRISSLEPSAIWFAHFGRHDAGDKEPSVEAVCTEAIDALEEWAAWVRKARVEAVDLDDVAAIVRRQAEAADERVPKESTARLEVATSYRMNVWGYMRYLDKLEEAGG